MSIEKINQAFKDISEAIKLVNTEIGKLVPEIDKISKSFENNKGLKELTEQMKALNEVRKTSDTLTKQQIDLLKNEEILRQSQEKTLQSQERTRRQKNATAQQEARIAEQNAKKTAELTSRYAQLSKELTIARNKAKDIGATYGTTSKQFTTAAKEVQKLDANLKKIDSNLGQSQRFVGQYEKGLKGLGSSFRNLAGAFGLMGGLQLFAGFIKGGIQSVKDYEKANAVLASVLGKSRKETEKLQNESKRLGRETAFTSQQVVDLQTELARLGKTESEIIASTEGIINATIALGSETGETASLVGATLNAFQLDAKESGRVADVLTLSTQRSALSFEKLNTALPIVAGAAAASGVSLETLVAQLGQAADRGIDASSAATSLRNIYLELAKKGITFAEAMEMINNSQDKLSTSNELFGKRAAVTGLALAATTTKTDELTKALENAGGTAKRVANEQLSTLEGATLLMGSAWDGLVKSLFKTEGATTFVNGLTAAIEDLRKKIIGASAAGDELAMEHINTINNESKDAADKVFRLQRAIETYQESIENVSKSKTDRSAFDWVITAINPGKLIADSKETNDIIAKNTEKYTATIKALETELTKALKQQQEERNETEIESIDLKDKTLEQLFMLQKSYKSLTQPTQAQSNYLAAINNELEKRLQIDEAVINKETDLIKIQEELLKQAKEMPRTTEAEIIARNRKIQSIEDEIARLNKLGEIKPLKQVEKMEVPEFDREAYDEEVDKEVLAEFEKEKEKTRILEEAEKERKQLREEFQKQALSTTGDFGNMFFELQDEKLTQETERIQQEYETRLANEQLDEEQRSLLEAERDAKIQQQERKKRALEKKQFIFQQGIKVAQIIQDAALGVAAATAQAPATAGASLAWIPIIKGTAALSIASILAQTIPAFDKGTDDFPGLGLVAEKRPEFVRKGSKLELMTQPTLLGKDYKGAEVISGAETAAILQNISRNEIVNHSNENYADMQIALAVERAFEKHSSKVVRELRKNRPIRDVKDWRTNDLRNSLRS